MYPWAEVINDIQAELRRSVKQHPRYPNDEVRRAAITAEEAGEVIKAALDVTREPSESGMLDLYKENMQLAAMAIKHMLALKDVDVTAYFTDPQKIGGKS